MVKKQPDIALIVLDSVRASTFYELLDNGGLRTFKRLAEDGVRYPKAVANGPWTVPSHGSMFTGEYPSKSGITGANPTWDCSDTLLEPLRDAGYTTVGISANPWLSPTFGFADGFDHFLTQWEYFFDSGDMTAVVGAETYREKLRQLVANIRKGTPGKSICNLLYSLHQANSDGDGGGHLVSRAEEKLSEVDSPYFLFANLTEAHLRYEPPEQYTRQHLPEGTSYEAALDVNQDPWDYVSGNVDMGNKDFETLQGLYRAAIRYVDDIVEPLVNALGDDTTVIITGDHGENIGDFDLMDHQYSVHQTLLHVPLLVAGPKAPSKAKRLVELRDIYPTILDLASTRDGTNGKGISLLSEDERQYAVSEYVSPNPDIETLYERSDDLRHEEHIYTDRRSAVQTTTNKLVYWEKGARELFDDSDRPVSDDRLTADLTEVLFDRTDVDGDVSSVDEQLSNKVVEDRLEDLGYI